MSYFDLIKADCLSSLSCLVNDIDSVLSNVGEHKHSNSFELLKRYIKHTYDDIQNCTTNTLQNWKTLMYVAMVLDDYELCFSDYLTRFGPLDGLTASAYMAIDRICEEVWFRSGFKDWKEQPSVVVFGGIPYSTNMGLCLIRLKPTDMHRVWNWGILGHELGHIITRPFTKATGTHAFSARDMSNIGKKAVDPLSPAEVLLSWQSEILADAFGTIAFGPCLLCAHAMIPRLWCFMEIEEPFLRFFSKHPPDECRYTIMQEVLDQNNLAKVDVIKELGLETVRDLEKTVDLKNSANEDKETFEDRLEDVELMTPQLWSWLKPLCFEMRKMMKTFSEKNWERSLEIAEYIKAEKKNPPDNILPSEILNGILCLKAGVKNLKEEKNIMKKAFHLFNSVKDENILSIGHET